MRRDYTVQTGWLETHTHTHTHTHAHTHIEIARDNGGELAERVGTRCEQLGGLPRERGEGVCPLEAGHDQVDSVVPRGVEGMSAANGCTRSLGGMETPGALEMARIPSVIVPECVVKGVSETPCARATPCASGVFVSVPECVLPSTPCVKGAPQAEGRGCEGNGTRVRSTVCKWNHGCE